MIDDEGGLLLQGKLGRTHTKNNVFPHRGRWEEWSTALAGMAKVRVDKD